MRNLQKRMEALERIAAAKRQRLRSIACSTLRRASHVDSELLISAFGSDREGLPLSEAQLAARQRYMSALKTQYQQAGLRVSIAFDHSSYMYEAILLGAGRPLSDEQLNLLGKAADAKEESCDLTEEESAAELAWNNEYRRLLLLAHLSMEEFRMLEHDPCPR